MKMPPVESREQPSFRFDASIALAVHADPDLRLAPDPTNQASARLNPILIQNRDCSGEGLAYVRHEDFAAPDSRPFLLELAKQAGSDKWFITSFQRIGFGFLVCPDDDAAHALVTRFSPHVNAVAGVTPYAE